MLPLCSWYSKAVDADPKNETLYSNRAASYSALNKHKEALQDSEKCITLKPTWVKGHFRKGIALCRLGRYPDYILLHASNRALYFVVVGAMFLQPILAALLPATWNRVPLQERNMLQRPVVQHVLKFCSLSVYQKSISLTTAHAILKDGNNFSVRQRGGLVKVRWCL